MDAFSLSLFLPPPPSPARFLASISFPTSESVISICQTSPRFVTVRARTRVFPSRGHVVATKNLARESNGDALLHGYSLLCSRSSLLSSTIDTRVRSRDTVFGLPPLFANGELTGGPFFIVQHPGRRSDSSRLTPMSPMRAERVHDRADSRRREEEHFDARRPFRFLGRRTAIARAAR